MSVNPNSKNISLKFDNLKRNNNSKQYKNKSNKMSTSIDESKEEISHELLSKILDTINSNSLNIFYPDSNNKFKKEIDSLNLKFYLETERYLSNKNKSEKCQTALFIILFKQINVYIKEIERLNLILVNKKFDPKYIMERTDEIIKKQNELLIKEELIKTLKESNSNIESKYLESIINEDKLKKEIQVLKKENDIFKKEKEFLHKYNHKLNGNKQKIKKACFKKEKSENLLKKMPYFHSSTIKNLMHDEIEVYTSREKHNYYNHKHENGADLKKRNNSDNKKIILEKIIGIGFNFGNANKGRKLLLQNYQKSKDKVNLLNNSNINKNNIYNTVNNINRNMTKRNLQNPSLSRKKTICIRLNNGVDNNYYNIVNNSQGQNTSDSKSLNLDYSCIKPIKTEYIISDLEDYKKGFIYENSIDNNNKKRNDNRDINGIFFYSKSKDKKIYEYYL